MRLLTRIFVLVLAVALVPLLRFIEPDACEQPSTAPFALAGISDQEPPGVVVDRKQSGRYIARGRAALGLDDGLEDPGLDFDLDDAELCLRPITRREPFRPSVSIDPASARRTPTLARGPPRA